MLIIQKKVELVKYIHLCTDCFLDGNFITKYDKLAYNSTLRV